MSRSLTVCGILAVSALLGGTSEASSFSFTTGAPDGRIGLASRPGGPGLETETADDFMLSTETLINSATFTGLLPTGLSLASINTVSVELYRLFPLDSTTPASGRVPTRVNSPSDNAFTTGNLTFTASVLNASFSVANTIIDGIHPIPNQTTGGEGPASGEEVRFDVTFTTPFDLPANQYFFVPEVGLSTGTFLWLSTAAPPQFTGDQQAWIRNENLAPDWLRAGTDIVGGATFNASFSLTGDTVTAPSVPEPASMTLLGTGLVALARRRLRRR